MPRQVPRKPVLLGAGVAIGLLVVTDLATHAKVFDLLRESNVPTWFSQALFLLAAVAAGTRAAEDRSLRMTWLALAAVMAFLSLDEVAMIHERAEHRIGVEATLLAIEPLVLLGIAGFVYGAARGGVDRVTLALLVAAVAALVLAQAVSAVNELVEPTESVYDVLAVIEEVLEMLTGAFALTAAIGQSSKNA